MIVQVKSREFRVVKSDLHSFNPHSVLNIDTIRLRADSIECSVEVKVSSKVEHCLKFQLIVTYGLNHDEKKLKRGQLKNH